MTKNTKMLDLKVNCTVDMEDAVNVPKNVSEQVTASVALMKSGIVTEKFPRNGDGVTLIRTYSKNGKYIIQDGTGVKYAEAIDPEFCHQTYTESDEDIENVEPVASSPAIETDFTDVGEGINNAAYI